jgi:hypothetical protein
LHDRDVQSINTIKAALAKRSAEEPMFFAPGNAIIMVVAPRAVQDKTPRIWDNATLVVINLPWARVDKPMARLDGALSDEASAAALRALIREWPAADDDGMGGLSFAALAKWAESVAISQAKVIACIRDGGRLGRSGRLEPEAFP